MFIDNLKDYTYLMIFSIFITNLIQMISPQGNMKKYITFISSLIVIIVLIEPVITFMNSEIDMVEVFNIEQEKVKELENCENDYINKIYESYKENLQKDIITRLEKSGYKVHDVWCEYDEETLEPKYIRLDISIDDGKVMPVKVEVTNESKTQFGYMDYFAVNNILREVYGFEEVEIEGWEN